MGQAEERFSRKDLLAAAVVVLILIALAAPVIVDRKLYANESAAVAAVRSIQSAQVKYAEMYPTVGFADDLAKLGPPVAGAQPDSSRANLLDLGIPCSAQPCEHAGYLLSIGQTSGVPVTKFRITAVPKIPGRTGTRGFCSSESGAITLDPAGGSDCSIKVNY